MLERETRRMAVDKVQFPRLYLVWHSPAAYREGDAEMDLVASILGEGNGSRLTKRLVLDERLARDVSVYQGSQELGSLFYVVVTAAEGADLETLKRVALEEIDRFREAGPTPAELDRARATVESGFLRRMESLRARADLLNAYRRYYGDPNSFALDLARFTEPPADAVRGWAEKVLGAERLDLRILPEGAKVSEADLDRRPEPLAVREYEPPVPETFRLSNGIPVTFVQRPGSGLFSGSLLVDGGQRLVPGKKAGLVSLAATMLTAGAGGLDAAAFADAVDELGASVFASASWHELTIDVSGLTSRLDATLDRFADAVLRPNLTEEDFARERDLALAAIRARVEEPMAVALLVGRAITFGKEDPRGRPSDGFLDTVEPLTRDEIREWLPRLLDATNARMVFAGDVDARRLRAALDKRFGKWKGSGQPAPPMAPPVTEAPRGRIVLVNRSGAPQSMLYLMRPIAPPDDRLRTLRETLNTLLGGSFTSRLNQNIREEHGYSYGAGSRIRQEGNQHALVAFSAVQTPVTGPALVEFRREIGGLAGGDVTADEMAKAVETVRYDLVQAAATTGSLAGTFAGLVSDGRPLDSLRRDLVLLGKISLEDLNGEARSGLYDWGRLLVVIVGDEAAIVPQLVEAGFGEPMRVDPEGNPLR
jgi:predicted Zn-dependent peptidase